MRKQNSEFLTAFTSEASSDLKNTDYFGFVELDDYACYVIADGIDDQLEASSAKLAVLTAVAVFSEAPSMSRRTMKKCLRAANKALLEAKSKTKLKASVMMVVTDYVKLRYGQAGNIRLRLYRNGFVKEKTTDQSLTMDMVAEAKVPQDKVAVHEERNNLYAYLGQEKDFRPRISKKIALTNADAVALYTGGVWEHVDEGEMEDVFTDASDDPKETVSNIEDLLLSRQPEDLKKYTFVVIFANKIFTDPNKKRKIKKILATAAAILMTVAVVVVIIAIFYNNWQKKKEKLRLGYTDTIEYIQMDNYVKAQESCGRAQELAEDVRDGKMQTELGNYQKLIEAVLAAEEQLDSGEYAQAQATFKEAAKRARYVDSLGLDYINGRLALTADYISVYDLLSLGDTLVLNLQYDKAEEKYMEAKATASGIYFEEGRKAAVEALEALYEEQKAQAEAESEARREQLAKEESAANYMAQGDAAFTEGDFDSARVFYTAALQKYEELDDQAQQEVVAEKLEAAGSKITSSSSQKEEAGEYVAQAEEAMEAGDYSGARKYYLLAMDIYAALKDDETLEEIKRKMQILDLKENERRAAAAEAAAETAGGSGNPDAPAGQENTDGGAGGESPDNGAGEVSPDGGVG